jgi:hypothetical protein
MDIVISIVLGVVASLIAAELYAHAPKLASWLIDRAARKLPNELRERYREEWQAHANDLTGHIAKLLHAIGCWCRKSSVRREAGLLTENEIKRIERFISIFLMGAVLSAAG